MSYAQTVILGILQGVTECLPISSSGILTMAGRLLPIPDDGLFSYTCLHMGSLLAILFVMRKDVLRVLMELLWLIRDGGINLGRFIRSAIRREEPHYIRILKTNYRCMALLVAGAAIPPAILGPVIYPLSVRISANPVFVAAGFLLTGVLLSVMDHVHTGNLIPKDVHPASGFLFGLGGCLALLPGVSYIGMVMAAGILTGFHRKLAFRLACLTGIPVIAGAFVYEMRTVLPTLSSGPQAGPVFVGGAAAALCTAVVLPYMLSIIRRKPLAGFAACSMAAGILSIVLSFVQHS